jgi:hypothetical protein
MKALRAITAATLWGIGAAATAQNAAPATAPNVHVYLVGKQDPLHIVITEVMEVPSSITLDELLVRASEAHPDIKLPGNTEGVRSTSASAARKSREDLKLKYEKAGKSVTVLEAH